MSSNDNAVIMYESGQNAHPMEAMTTVDRLTFEASFKPFSDISGFEAKIMPNGLVNGGEITPSATSDSVDVSAALVQMAANSGADSQGRVTIAGETVACARPTTSTHLIYSIVISETGAVSATPGSEGTSFSEVRGEAGAPPLIPVDSIEIGQVRYSEQASAPVPETAIKQVPGLHQEMADFPVYQVNQAKGEVTFATELPAIHVGGEAKKVYAEGFTPIFAEVPNGYDWTPSEVTHSVNSQQVYGNAIGSTSSSIGQASFSAILSDGITDNILQFVDENIWIKFKQDRNRQPYQLTQGKLGLSRSFPADGNVSASFTLSSQRKSQDMS